MGLDGRTSAALQSDRASRPRRVFLYDRDRYIYNDLTRRTGALVFSAAHAGELSFESPKIQNGVFTWEIVDALVSGRRTSIGTARSRWTSSRPTSPAMSP